MQAFILAGGFGSRLRSIVVDRPKPMALVGGKPFLEIVISNLVKQGIKDIVIGVGYLSSQIEEYFKDGSFFGAKISYSREDIPLGTGGAIRNAISQLEDTFVVLNGDTYVDLDFEKLILDHQKSDKKMTMVLTSVVQEGERGSVSVDQEGNLVSFSDEDGECSSDMYSNSGVYVVSKKILKHIKTNSKISFEKDIIPTLIWAGEKIHAHITSKRYYDIGTPDRYTLAIEKLMESRRKYVGTANLRVSFCGGGTDLKEFYQIHGGMVISACIDKKIEANIYQDDQTSEYVEIFLQNYGSSKKILSSEIDLFHGDKFDIVLATLQYFGIKAGISIEIGGDIPPESGLATSSATVIALIRAICLYKNISLGKEEIANIAVKIEREILKQPGGIQDQYQISYGGINLLKISVDGDVEVVPITLNSQQLRELNDRLVLYYQKRINSGTHQQISLIKKIHNSKKTISSLIKTLSITEEIYQCFNRAEFGNLGMFLNQAWDLKKKSSPSITSVEIDSTYTKILQLGAQGGKLLGAGSGGCFLICAESINIEKIKSTLTNLEKSIIDFKIVN